MKPKTSGMLGKCSNTELHHQTSFPPFSIFLGIHAMIWMVLPFQNSYWSLRVNETVFKDVTFKDDSVGRTLPSWIGLGILMKVFVWQEFTLLMASSVPSIMWGHNVDPLWRGSSKLSSYKQRAALTSTKPADTLTLGFLTSKPWEINFLLMNFPVCSILL